MLTGVKKKKAIFRLLYSNIQQTERMSINEWKKKVTQTFYNQISFKYKGRHAWTKKIINPWAVLEKSNINEGRQLTNEST